jgi:hypothetical protein
MNGRCRGLESLAAPLCTPCKWAANGCPEMFAAVRIQTGSYIPLLVGWGPPRWETACPGRLTGGWRMRPSVPVAEPLACQHAYYNTAVDTRPRRVTAESSAPTLCQPLFGCSWAGPRWRHTQHLTEQHAEHVQESESGTIEVASGDAETIHLARFTPHLSGRSAPDRQPQQASIAVQLKRGEGCARGFLVSVGWRCVGV